MQRYGEAGGNELERLVFSPHSPEIRRLSARLQIPTDVSLVSDGEHADNAARGTRQARANWGQKDWGTLARAAYRLTTAYAGLGGFFSATAIPRLFQSLVGTAQ